MERPPDPQLIQFLEAYDPHISELALALRGIILEEAPDASESIYQVYTVAIWFGFSGKMKDMFCYITTHARHVNLGFPGGAALPDPSGALEGEGKAMRHIKFARLQDAERPFLRRYIQSAMEQAAPAGTRGTGKTVVRSNGAGGGAAKAKAPKAKAPKAKAPKARAPKARAPKARAKKRRAEPGSRRSDADPGSRAR